MYNEIILMMKTQGIVFERGLTESEISKISEIYEITFPNSVKNFLMAALPISKGFYNWRNFTYDNICQTKQMIDWPISWINDDPQQVYWCETWGKEPEESDIFAEKVRCHLKEASKLIPIYCHRYIPMGLSEDPPIISVYGGDVIYYGSNLREYFQVEFGEKEQSDIDFGNIQYVPFWSDIM